MMILRHLTDSAKSHDLTLTGSIVHIGRLAENDIVLKSPRAPDIAAEVKFCDNKPHIQALQSGALRINGKKNRYAQLNPGDKIEIGDDVLIVDFRKEGRGASISGNENNKPENILKSLNLFAEIVGRERDLNTLIRKIIDILLEILGGDDAFIFKLDTSGKPQLFASSNREVSEEHFSDTIVQQTLKQETGIFIQNALQHPDLSSSRSIADLQLTSVLCSPIKVADKIIGVIYLGAKRNSQSYTGSDLAVLNTYAVIAGMLIHHVEYISQQLDAIRKLTEYTARHEGIVAESKKMKDIIKSLDSIADSDISVLLEGETGTGKDLLAKLIHNKSKRSKKHTIVVNCSSIQKELQESELFGHIKGSFTGAIRDHKGLFAAAHNGTIFLDEIGDMDYSLQAKFLRVLETGKIRPVGSPYEESVDVRIICATNKNLDEMVSNGTFRKDLYYRINQCRFRLPPVREREDDCVLLAYFFLEKYKAEYPDRPVVDFHPETLNFIKTYGWPGNVRELASAVHKTVLSSTSPFGKIEGITPTVYDLKTLNFEQAVKEFQKALIEKTLKNTCGNKELAAKNLSLSRSTFFRYLSVLDI